MWNKKTSLSQQGENMNEIWIRESNGITENFPVDCYLGKKTNLLKLKSKIISTLAEKAKYYRESRTKLYNNDLFEDVKNCPITEIETSECKEVANIYGAKYVQTPDTGHVYVKNRPIYKSIHNFYLNDITYAATYTDKSGAENRLNAIAKPWLEWTKKVFYKQYGRNPEKILDVGSGAGHFIEACIRDGIDAKGIELSESSRKFSKEIWDIELDGRNFLDVTDEYNEYDIVTFWGLLEHTPNPKSILSAAYKVIGKEGMVISKLPRWNSLSSAIQLLNPETIIRHIDPMGHIMLFTDSSAAEMYYLTNFKPIAAWYYGMDIYETFMQLSHLTSNLEILNNTGLLQQELQQYIDEQKYSDGITLVGIPQ
jgi:2-polyprenyl-3-methyl-5-hydroxy-6-metoxy-1,4-benzoquinol methylase